MGKSLVVFVHGLDADDKDWWGSTESSLRNNPPLTEKYDIRFFSYKTDKIQTTLNDVENGIGLGEVQALLGDLGAQLSTYLTHECKNQNHSSIKLFGHSMGGLVIGASLPMLEKHHSDIYDNISSIAFAGTPLGGSSVATVLKKFLGFIVSSQTKSISINAAELLKITNPLPSYLTINKTLTTKIKKHLVFFRIGEDEVVSNDEERYGIFSEDMRNLQPFQYTLTGKHSQSVRNLAANSANFKEIYDWILSNNINSVNDTLTISKEKNSNAKNNNELDILIIGGANIEYIYKKNTPKLTLNNKQNFNAKAIEYGGSGLNYSLRLMSVNSQLNVLPILPIGNDPEGVQIFNILNNLDSSLNKEDIVIDGINTIESLILATDSGRTILSQEYAPENKDLFFNHIKKKISTIAKTKFIMIGHIHADKKHDEYTQPEMTKYIIDNIPDNTLIYLNLGKSQLYYGFTTWIPYFQKATILQFNLEEVKYLFNQDEAYRNITLSEIINKFQELKVTVVITLDNLGALCIVANDTNVIYAQELHLEKLYKDKTGAGDAFASGIIYSLLQNKVGKNIEYTNMYEAMIQGRLWATYACKELGGASNCPNIEELKLFENNGLYQDVNGIKDKQIHQAESSIISLIDKVYLKCNLGFHDNL